MIKAIYAGSFDPLTFGHMAVIEKGSKIFDQLVVLVASNPSKRESYMFTPEERVAMAHSAVAGYGNVTAASMSDGYVVDYADRVSATVLLRGIRSIEDYAAESLIDELNARASPKLVTVFVRPPAELALISSSFVKEQAFGPQGWEKKAAMYVPVPVLAKLEERHNDNRSS